MTTIARRCCHDIAGFLYWNITYWKKDPLEVARLGLAKMRTAVEKALDAA